MTLSTNLDACLEFSLKFDKGIDFDIDIYEKRVLEDILRVSYYNLYTIVFTLVDEFVEFRVVHDWT